MSDNQQEILYFIDYSIINSAKNQQKMKQYTLGNIPLFGLSSTINAQNSTLVANNRFV